jgi:hypothetical protein
MFVDGPDPGTVKRTVWHSPTLRTGLSTGIFLAGLLLLSLLAANRFPALEPYALARNSIACTLVIIVALIPIMRFHNSPVCLFASSALAWAIFSLAYTIAGMHFVNLESRLGKSSFEVLILGVVIYGVAAVLTWVFSMVFSALRHPIPIRRRVRHDIHRAP